MVMKILFPSTQQHTQKTSEAHKFWLGFAKKDVGNIKPLRNQGLGADG
jgi:hypothetical protein